MDEVFNVSSDIVRRGRLLRAFRESLGVPRSAVQARMGWSSGSQLASYELGQIDFSERQLDRILDAIRAVAAEKGTL